MKNRQTEISNDYSVFLAAGHESVASEFLLKKRLFVEVYKQRSFCLQSPFVQKVR